MTAPGREATAPQDRSYFTLTTANGRNVTLVDARDGRVTAFLDHPYRYLRPGPTEAAFGPERRNLLVDLGLGVDGRPPGAVLEAGYVEETNIVRVRFAGQVTLTVVAPFGLALNAALFDLTTPGPASSHASLSFRLGLRPIAEPFWKSPFDVVPGPGDPVVLTPRPGLVTVRGPGEGLLVYRAVGATLATRDAPPGDLNAPVVMTGHGPGPGFLVAYLAEASSLSDAVAEIDAWVAGREAGSLIDAELAAWRTWRRPVPVRLSRSAEIAVWRQCEAVLRMGQVREPAADGMILASLAPGEWSIGWVRDACYAIAALARAGYRDESRRALRFLLGNRQSGRHRDRVGGVPYRISVVRYFGDGQEEADFAGHQTPNVEMDGWGLVLWAVRIAVDEGGDLAWLDERLAGRPIYDILRDEVAEAIAAQIEPEDAVMRPDSSIWEVHQENARHFLYTSATAARGLADFASLARRLGRTDDAARFGALADAMRTAIPVYFCDPSTGHLLGAKERSPETDIDGAVFELFALGVAPDLESPVARATYAALEALRVPAGGYRRSTAGGDYASAEWAFVTLRAASLAARRGRITEARRLVDLTTERAAVHFGLIPETYGVAPAAPAGFYTGSIPMVGYGAGLYILAQLDLAAAIERSAGDPDRTSLAEADEKALVRPERE